MQRSGLCLILYCPCSWPKHVDFRQSPSGSLQVHFRSPLRTLPMVPWNKAGNVSLDPTNLDVHLPTLPAMQQLLLTALPYSSNILISSYLAETLVKIAFWIPPISSNSQKKTCVFTSLCFSSRRP